MDINGHPIIAAIPAMIPIGDSNEITEYVCVLRSKYHEDSPEYIVAWVPSLTVDHWGQGHYYRTLRAAVAGAISRAELGRDPHYLDDIATTGRLS